jgi:hypothetical protein
MISLHNSTHSSRNIHAGTGDRLLYLLLALATEEHLSRSALSPIRAGSASSLVSACAVPHCLGTATLKSAGCLTTVGQIQSLTRVDDAVRTGTIIRLGEPPGHRPVLADLDFSRRATMHGPGAGMTTRRARFARGWIAAISHSCRRVLACPRRQVHSGHGGHRILRTRRVLLLVRPCRLPAPRPPSFLSQLLFHGPFSLLADARSAASTPARSRHAPRGHATVLPWHCDIRGACEGFLIDAVPLDNGSAMRSGPVFSIHRYRGPPTLTIAL